jgi:hypothetical protein
MVSQHYILYHLSRECIYHHCVHEPLVLHSIVAGHEARGGEGMVEHTAGSADQETLNKATPGSRWRNILMTIGFFGILAALFIGASMKAAASGVPKVLALGAIALIVISGIWALIDRISHKGRRGPQTTA